MTWNDTSEMKNSSAGRIGGHRFKMKGEAFFEGWIGPRGRGRKYVHDIMK